MPTLGCKQPHLDILSKCLCSYIPVRYRQCWRIYIYICPSKRLPVLHPVTPVHLIHKTNLKIHLKDTKFVSSTHTLNQTYVSADFKFTVILLLLNGPEIKCGPYYVSIDVWSENRSTLTTTPASFLSHLLQ